jgi:D-beta-D-heptose 7-phosphate kinase/D-beta-D-heptose 1-phosphate adenosyltransferase
MISKFRNLSVLVVGDLVLDKYTIGSVKRISPEAPVPILQVEDEFYRLGGAANVAANVVSLGGMASLVGMMGADNGGDIIARECGKKGILLRAIPSPVPTTIKNRYMAGRQQLLRVDWESVIDYESSEQANLINTDAEELAYRADVIVVSDYGKGVVSNSLVARLRLAYPSKVIVVDPKPVNSNRYIGATVIKPNEKEAHEMMLALGFGSCPTPDAAAKLSAHYGASVAITRGDKGIMLAHEGKVTEVPTAAQEIYDVTGAGDAVTACLALVLGAEESVVRACEVANVAGGIAVGHIGVAAVTAAELKGRLSQ